MFHSVNMQDNNGQTALHMAVKRNDSKLVKSLLTNEHIDINTIRDDNGRTAFDIARDIGNTEIITMLHTNLLTRRRRAMKGRYDIM